MGACFTEKMHPRKILHFIVIETLFQIKTVAGLETNDYPVVMRGLRILGDFENKRLPR